MLKDFSQPFSVKKSLVYTLIEENTSSKFFCFMAREDMEDYGLSRGWSTLSFYSSPDKDFVNQLAAFLYKEGFSLNSFRELVRETQVSFSFVDNTLGELRDIICVRAKVDRIGKATKAVRLLTFEDFAKKLQISESASDTAKAGIAIIMNER